jgi:hypothetical protein
MTKKLFGVPEYEGPMSRRIRVLAKNNPKRKGSKAYLRFDQYKDGLTIADYIRACDKLPGAEYALIDISWDKEHKFIELYDN